MIRQAISCDICASEKKQTNHWFVVYEQGGELRVSGWNSRNRLRPGSKHLCGQTCLHKLIDEFVAKAIAQPLRGAAAKPDAVAAEALPAKTDTSLTGNAAFAEFESSARLITPFEPAISAPVLPAPAVAAPMPAAALKPPMEVLAMPAKPNLEPLVASGEEPRFASRSWRNEAWERERERELRAAERRPDITRRRSRA